MATAIKVEFNNSIAWMTFTEDSERRPCTLDFDVLDQLDAALDQIEKAQNVKCVVVRAASEKYFIVGANIAALQKLDPAGMDAWVRRGHAAFNRLEDFPLPVIACVAGAAMGGGLELAMACDFIVAGDGARFAQPEAGLGFLMGWGGNHRLVRLVGPARAKMMYYTGHALSAAEAFAFGLAALVTPAGELYAKAEAIASAIVNNSADGIRMTKEILNIHTCGERARAVGLEASGSYACLDKPETKARMEAFFAARAKK